MWPDDKYWLPRVLEGEKIEAVFHFDSEGDNIEDYDVEETVF